MKTNCLDIGIIQAFLDGELIGAEAARVSDHIGGCDSCAERVARAEDENAVVFPALAREFDTMVPTQRLWARIEGSIQFEKDAAPWWQKLYGIIISGFASPSFAVAAGVLIIVAIFAVFALRRPSGNEVAVVPTNAPIAVQNNVLPAKTTEPAIAVPTSQPTSETATYRAPRKVAAQPAVANSTRPVVVPVVDTSLPGEESYVNTIASLTKSGGADQDPNVMRVSERVSYERDMALVDDNIKRMRAAVKKNPKNETSKQMLSTAYQNKIDLLSSVAQKEELVASLNR